MNEGGDDPAVLRSNSMFCGTQEHVSTRNTPPRATAILSSVPLPRLTQKVFYPILGVFLVIRHCISSRPMGREQTTTVIKYHPLTIHIKQRSLKFPRKAQIRRRDAFKLMEEQVASAISDTLFGPRHVSFTLWRSGDEILRANLRLAVGRNEE